MVFELFSRLCDGNFFGGGENIFAENGSWGVIENMDQVLIVAYISPLYFA
jgi:hypothetical protein